MPKLEPYLFVGLRGMLELSEGVRARWDAGELDEDVFSLVVKRSETLGLADFSGDPRARPQWGHADAGGTLSSTVGSEAWNSRDLKSRPH